MPGAFLIALFATPVLAGLALSLGWIDRREGVEERKPRTSPVPLVGGAAVLAGFVFAAWSVHSPSLAWPALIAAFLLGLVDDVVPGGLKASTKLAGQAGVAILVVVAPGEAWADAGLIVLAGLAVLSVVAMNAINTFDHQDGVAGVTSGLALATGAPALAASVAGYLPFNTIIRRRSKGDGSVPIAMLGDSGSHLLGVAIATTPGAPALLLVPLLDIARVARARVARGQPIWIGDRTHVGHRLAALGFGPVAVAALVGLIVAPPVVTGALSDTTGALVLGLALSAALFYLAIHVTAAEPLEPAGAARPGEDPDGGSEQDPEESIEESIDRPPGANARADPPAESHRLERDEPASPPPAAAPIEDEPPRTISIETHRHPLTGNSSTGSGPPAGPFADSDPTS